MKIHFEITPEFSEKDPHILIQAAQLTDQARGSDSHPNR